MTYCDVLLDNAREKYNLDIIKNNRISFFHEGDLPELKYKGVIIITNNPELKSRTLSVTFPNNFVAEPKKENEREIDKNMFDKLPLFASDFMLLLIEAYQRHIEINKKVKLSL